MNKSEGMVIRFTKAENLEQAIEILKSFSNKELKAKLKALSIKEIAKITLRQPEDCYYLKRDLFYIFTLMRDEAKVAELIESYNNGTFKNEDVKGLSEHSLQEFVYSCMPGDNNDKNESVRKLIPYLENYEKVHNVLSLIENNKFDVERDLKDFTLDEMYSLVSSMTQNHTGRCSIAGSFRPHIREEDRCTQKSQK